MNPETTILANLIMYLIGFVVLFSFKRTKSLSFSDWLVLGLHIMGIIFASSLQDAFGDKQSFLFNWIKLGNTNISFELLLDNQAYFLFVIIQVIGFLVSLFATKYLKNDSSINRFYAYICLFEFSMLGLVISGNLYQFYMFWELVGFCSFLLIGYWYKKKYNNAQAFKAFLINKFGDCFLLIGLFYLYNYSGSFRFADMANHPPSASLYLGLIFAMGGIVSKSAQIPLQIWLPKAMVGPTPASALIHAATMVVSGVFLLGRLNPIIPFEVRILICFIGVSTALLAAVSALFQNDLKSVLAYSTISQLGFMVTAMGVGAVGASLFHLATHAFFKAGLFLGAGAVIEHQNHVQDMRKMGGLRKLLPFIFYSFLLCAASLVGVPFTAGFLSKEAIISSSIGFLNGNWLSYKALIPILLITSSFVTALYVIRMVVMIFLNREEDYLRNLIEGTKKTLGSAKKTFSNVLTGEKQDINQKALTEAWQTIGTYEVVMLSLAFCSLYFLFSDQPLHYYSIWYIRVFEGTKAEFNWLPWLMNGLLFLALLIAYNTTYDEIKNYYLEKKDLSAKKKLFKAFNMHFYFEKTYSSLFKKMVLKYNEERDGLFRLGILGKNALLMEKSIDHSISLIQKGFLESGELIAKIDQKYVDKAVNLSTSGIYELGRKLKNLQANPVQFYFYGIVFTFVVIALIVILL